MRAGGSVHARAHAHARAQCAMEARCVPARRGPRGAWGARCALVDGRSAPPRRYQAGRGTRRRRAKGAGMPAPLVRWSGGAHGTAQGKGAASGWVDAWGDAWVVRMRGSWAHSSGSLAFFISLFKLKELVQLTVFLRYVKRRELIFRIFRRQLELRRESAVSF